MSGHRLRLQGPDSRREPSIAVVHDFLYCYSGAERVLEQILRIYPQADVFALFDFLPGRERSFLGGRRVRSTFIQCMPLARRHHRMYLPLMPLAIEQLDLSAYDIIISSSYLAAKGVLVRPDQLHVCYCHTPARYAWDLQHQYLDKGGLGAGIRSSLARMLLHYIRNWDVRSSNGVDVFVTNSDFVARRVQKAYRRPSVTIYPPVDTERFVPGEERQEFYLTASRLVSYKRTELIVEAFARMPDKQLMVIGDGPELAKLASRATRNVRLLGHQPKEELIRHMQKAKAFVFAAEEDFGIVVVEAQLCGTPVLAYGRGGVVESVEPGRSGVLFEEQTAKSICEAVATFARWGVSWHAGTIRQNSLRFSAERFRKEFESLVEAEWEKSRAARLSKRASIGPWRGVGGADEEEADAESLRAVPVAAG